MKISATHIFHNNIYTIDGGHLGGHLDYLHNYIHLMIITTTGFILAILETLILLLKAYPENLYNRYTILSYWATMLAAILKFEHERLLQLQISIQEAFKPYFCS